MPSVHELDDDAMKFINDAYLRLWVAFVASLLTVLVIWKPFFGLAWMVTWLAGPSGISRASRVIPVNPLVKYAAFILTMAPVLAVPPLAWYVHRTRRFLQGEEPPAEAPPAAAPRKSISRPAAEAASAPAAAAAAKAAPAAGSAAAAGEPPPAPVQPTAGKGNVARAAGALPSIKAAGLQAMPEGQRLRAKIRQPGVEMTEADEPVILTAKGTFAIAYVADIGSHFAWLTMGDLQEAGMDTAALHQAALDNLTRRVNGEGGPGLTLHPMGDAWGLAMGGEHEAALVLADELWEGPLKQYTPNGPVVAIPARDICAFCDSRSAEGIGKLKGIVQKVTEGGRGLVSDKLFRREGDQWQPFQ